MRNFLEFNNFIFGLKQTAIYFLVSAHFFVKNNIYLRLAILKKMVFLATTNQIFYFDGYIYSLLMTDNKSSRENNSKMVLLTTATNMSNFDMNDSIPSPTESSEEVPNQLLVYLQRLAGYCENEGLALIKDHSYARPWNWKPENIYNKPVKKLFFSDPQTPITPRY